MKKLLIGVIITLGPLILTASGAETTPSPAKATAALRPATETRMRSATAKAPSGETVYVASKGATPAKESVRNMVTQSPTTRFFKAVNPFNVLDLLNDSDE